MKECEIKGTIASTSRERLTAGASIMPGWWRRRRHNREEGRVSARKSKTGGCTTAQVKYPFSTPANSRVRHLWNRLWPPTILSKRTGYEAQRTCSTYPPSRLPTYDLRQPHRRGGWIRPDGGEKSQLRLFLLPLFFCFCSRGFNLIVAFLSTHVSIYYFCASLYFYSNLHMYVCLSKNVLFFCWSTRILLLLLRFSFSVRYCCCSCVTFMCTYLPFTEKAKRKSDK